jgi:hypothetical protein
VDRTLHAASCRTILEVQDGAHSDQRVVLTIDDFETARKDFVPVALKGISIIFVISYPTFH